jgi:hypothetical protein
MDVDLDWLSVKLFVISDERWVAYPTEAVSD